MSADRFATALRLVLEFEGGKVDDPDDRGGRTAFGITQRTFDAWRAKGGGATSDVWTITPDEVAAIYRAEYWEAQGCEELAVPLDLVLFDSAVQHSTATLGRLKACAGMSEDPRLRAYGILVARAFYYRQRVEQSPTQAKYLKGWMNRIERVRLEAGL